MKHLIVMAIALYVVALPSLWAEDFVDINIASHHWNRNYVSKLDLNERNWGVGYEHTVSNERIMVGVYKNSFSKNSAYVLFADTPINIGKFSAGALGGVVSGYSNAPLRPSLGGLITYQISKVGINLILVPDMEYAGHHLIGFASLQARFKF